MLAIRPNYIIDLIQSKAGIIDIKRNYDENHCKNDLTCLRNYLVFPVN